MKEAMLYEKVGNKKVQCNLCAHRCKINEGKKGICLVRENRDGILYTLVYGRTISQAIDPIEKKPLFNFYPGTTAYSIATVGCNFKCQFCQNWEISQMVRDKHLIMGNEASPESIVENAKRYGSKSIAYTYTEPTIFFEYAYDTAKLAHEADIKNVFVTNGYMTEEALKEINPYLDAANVDLKSFSDDFYRKLCGARLQPVLDALKLMKKLGIWVEVTTLIIPSLNDSADELGKIAKFIVNELDDDTPWHISRFYPSYNLKDKPPTPIDTIHKAREIGLNEGLKYVYEGNVPDSKGESTYCPNCKNLVIKRWGYQITKKDIKDGICQHCSFKIDGVGL
ncbi:MAG: AmmeMemoRadiSam system radical SAM enzyme [Actinomycetota bacterium]